MAIYRPLAVLLALASVLQVALAAYPIPFDIEQGDGLEVEPTGNSLWFHTDELTGSNIWTKVSAPETGTNGASTSFHINVEEVEATSEIKFTVMTSIILRLTNNGQTAKWMYWTGSFKEIGSSSIVAGSGTHSVTITVNPDGFVVTEDGKLVGTYDKASDVVLPTYHMQCLTQGASLKIYVTDIAVYNGVDKPAWSYWKN